MNREIKFRVWIEKEMMLGAMMVYFDLLSEDNRWIEEKKGPIMQFTGLKDKNGKEIYEGDIVKLSYSKEPNPRVIEWEEKLGRWSVFTDYTAAFAFEEEEVEVIGNIYENPELTEGKKKRKTKTYCPDCGIETNYEELAHPPYCESCVLKVTLG